jgi:hypothetical protein
VRDELHLAFEGLKRSKTGEWSLDSESTLPGASKGSTYGKPGTVEKESDWSPDGTGNTEEKETTKFADGSRTENLTETYYDRYGAPDRSQRGRGLR